MSDPSDKPAPARQIQWPRFLIEGVVIVGSILLAFGIEAWWEERGERDQTRQNLLALLDELEINRAQLDSCAVALDRSAEGTYALLELMGPDAEPVEIEGLASAFFQSVNMGIFFGQDAVLTAMLGSGELADLQNESLMILVGSWQASVEAIRLDTQQLERNREEVLFEELMRLGVPITLGQRSPPFGDFPPNKFTFDTRSILTDVRLAGALESRALRATLVALDCREAATP